MQRASLLAYYDTLLEMGELEPTLGVITAFVVFDTLQQLNCCK
jgi:hypothetical protein